MMAWAVFVDASVNTWATMQDWWPLCAAMIAVAFTACVSCALPNHTTRNRSK